MSEPLATKCLIAANAIAEGCPAHEVYSHVARATEGCEDVGIFLADPSNPFVGLTRDETLTGLCLAAAALRV